MPDYRSIVEENEASRDRLKTLCGRLYEVDLGRPVAAGWTVAGKLAHLAFWERQALFALEAFERTARRRGDVAGLIARTGEWLPAVAVEQWQRVGVDWSDAAGRNRDALNQRALPAWLAVPPHVALRESVNAAELLDAKLSVLAPKLVRLVLAS